MASGAAYIGVAAGQRKRCLVVIECRRRPGFGDMAITTLRFPVFRKLAAVDVLVAVLTIRRSALEKGQRRFRGDHMAFFAIHSAVSS